MRRQRLDQCDCMQLYQRQIWHNTESYNGMQVYQQQIWHNTESFNGLFLAFVTNFITCRAFVSGLLTFATTEALRASTNRPLSALLATSCYLCRFRIASTLLCSLGRKSFCSSVCWSCTTHAAWTDQRTLCLPAAYAETVGRPQSTRRSRFCVSVY